MRLTARSSVAALLAACCCIFSAAVKAEPIPIFSTGTAADGSLLAGGSVDPHFTIIASPTGPGNAFVVSAAPGAWVAAGPGQWLSTQANANFVSPIGTYTFRTTFDLTGFDLSTVAILGSISADDWVQIFLNGADTGITLAGFGQRGQFGQFQTFSLTSGFVSGINTIDFVVTNPGIPHPGGGELSPTGLRVGLQGVGALGGPGPGGPGSDVPEPATLLLFGTGLAGLSILTRRGRKQ